MQVILNKRGSSIAVKNGRFWIRTDEQEHFLAATQIKQICLHQSTKLTYEVVALAVDSQIDIQFIDAKGFPMARIWSNKFGSISTIRKNQIAFAANEASIHWVKSLLVKKADNHIVVLKLLTELKQGFNESGIVTAKKIDNFKHKIIHFPVNDRSEAFSSMRGFEGQMSKIYFEFINSILPENYRFERRSQHPAKDMFNCLLNYAYGMLYSQVEGALIKAGIDPYLGVMHRDEYNRPVLVYDIIEIYRFWADYVVCHLCLQEVIYAEFFEVTNGNYWLNVSGKRILIHTFNDYLAEIILFNGLSRSRQVHIEIEAQQLATKLKSFNA